MTKPMSWLPDPLKGGQDQVGVPQVPLFGHGDALETWKFCLYSTHDTGEGLRTVALRHLLNLLCMGMLGL